MALMYKTILFCLLGLATKNLFGESKTMKVKIQSLYNGQFLNPLIGGPPFGNDDTATWQIDWDGGISNRTSIRTFLPTGWHRIVVFSLNRVELEPEVDPLDNSGDWVILSNYSSTLGRYYHKFRSNTIEPNQCINTPFSETVGGPPLTRTPCNENVRQQFLISYAE